jgi:hypothetical protein
MLQISMELHRSWKPKIAGLYQNRLRPNGIKNYAPTKCLQDFIQYATTTLITLSFSHGARNMPGGYVSGEPAIEGFSRANVEIK